MLVVTVSSTGIGTSCPRAEEKEGQDSSNSTSNGNPVASCYFPRSQECHRTTRKFRPCRDFEQASFTRTSTSKCSRERGSENLFDNNLQEFLKHPAAYYVLYYRRAAGCFMLSQAPPSLLLATHCSMKNMPSTPS